MTIGPKLCTFPILRSARVSSRMLVVLLATLTLAGLWFRYAFDAGVEVVDSEKINAGQGQQTGQDRGRTPEKSQGPLPIRDESQRQAMTALVEQALSEGQIGRARSALLQWPRNSPDEAQQAFLVGLCDWSEKNIKTAQAEFERALAIEPGHLRAHASLGRLLEQQERIGEALPHYSFLVTSDSNNTSFRIDLSRVLRKLGRTAEAEQVLPKPTSVETSQIVALEMAEREYASGNYSEAVAWFHRADLNGSHLAETLRTAASAMALLGDYVGAQQLFERVDDAQDRARQANELQRRLSIDPNDPKSIQDLQQLSSQVGGNQARHIGSLLYHVRCSACHGDQGEANGRAARFLFPRPRNLRSEPLRLVSTLNAIAHPSDIAAVIKKGIPGTSMPAFPDFTEAQLQELIGIVLQFRREGIRQEVVEGLSDSEGDAWDEAKLEQVIARRSTPAELLEIPAKLETSPEAVERGRLAFNTVGCSRCHNLDESQLPDLLLFDDAGNPSLPRDLARDFMKGGDDPAALFKRVRLGMPGTAHPAFDAASTEQLLDLVSFCRSLSVEPKRVLTNQQRAQQAATRF